jgi:hypothetical protein
MEKQRGSFAQLFLCGEIFGQRCEGAVQGRVENNFELRPVDLMAIRPCRCEDCKEHIAAMKQELILR